MTGIAASLGAFIWLAFTGVTWGAAAAIVAALALQTCLGAIIWAWVRSRSGGAASSFEVLGMGFVLGSILSMVSGVVFRPVVPGGFGWAALAVVVLVAWLVRKHMRRGTLLASNQNFEWPRRSVLWGFVAGVLVGLSAVIVNLARYPLHWTGAWNQYHPDMVFFEALANSVARYGTGESIFMSGEDLRYHWFTYAWSGQLSDSLGLEPFVVLTRVLPMATLLASAGIAAVWAGRYTKTPWAPGLAAVLVTAGGYVGATYGTLLNFDSPSQALTTLWLLGLSFAVLEYLNGALSHRTLWVIGLLSVACVGGKANAAIVAIGALVVLVVVGFIRRSPWRVRAGWALIVSGIPAAIAYLLVLSGSANSGGLLLFNWANRASSVQGLDLGVGGLGIAAGTVILMIAVAPRWAGLLGLWLEPEQRWAPTSIFGAGLLVMGIVPLAVLSQGVNELWFALAASAPLAVISAIGVGVAWESLGDRAPLQRNRRTALLLASANLGLVFFVLASMLWRQGAPGVTSVRALGPILMLVGAAAGALVLCWISRSIQAGRRIALLVIIFITILVTASALARVTPLFDQLGSRLSPTESVSVLGPALDSALSEIAVATDADNPPVTLSGLNYDDNSWSELEVAAARFLVSNTSDNDIIVTDRTSSWLVAALTGRRTFMSGAPYQQLYGRASAIEAIPGRVGVSQRFGAAPTQVDFDELCAAGVTWGWFSPEAGNRIESWAPYADVMFENESVQAVQLDRSKC